MALHATATWREIHQQPALWRHWAADPAIGRARAWMAGLAPREVWLCGAGTSAFIGDIVAAGLEGQGGPRLRAVPTTDLVSRPRAYLPTDALVIHFGRSGDSAESLGVMDALDALSPATPRLHVTCNARGALATRPAPGPAHVLVLPDAAHDRGFAMTSSFTTMLLTALALLAPEGAGPIPALAGRLEALLPRYAAYAEAAPVPERLVVLGSGAGAMAARECALKVMELTRGRVATLWDSALGYRHGPRSFADARTPILILGSSDPHAALYERDLAAELRASGAEVTVAGEGGNVDAGPLPGGAWDALLLVPLAQVLAAAWSDRMGLDVDDPFAGAGTLSRVVTGVRLHPVAP